MIDIENRRSHYIEMYKNGRVKKFYERINKASSRIKRELLSSGEDLTKREQKAIIKTIDDAITKEFLQAIKELTEELGDLAINEAEFTKAALEQAYAFKGVKPAKERLIAAIRARPFNTKLLGEYLDAFTSTQATLVKNTISLGFLEGKTTDQIVRQIVGTSKLQYKDGIIEVSKVSARRMVRTAISHVASTAKLETLKANKNIVSHYIWVSTLDSRTSITCMSLDNNIYEVDKGPIPPAHYNCRSTIAGLTDDEVQTQDGRLTLKKTSATRASKDGQVSANENYDDFLKRQSDKFQDDVLGKTRADLYRSGKLTIDKFVNDDNKVLTIQELTLKFPEALGK